MDSDRPQSAVDTVAEIKRVSEIISFPFKLITDDSDLSLVIQNY